MSFQRRDEYYFEFNLEEQLAEIKKYKIFGVEDMYTIADAWGWTWEKDLDVFMPEKWTKEREVTLGMKLMKKVHNNVAIMEYNCIHSIFICFSNLMD